MPAATQNQEQFATDASLMKTYQLAGNEKPGFPLGFDGNTLFFYPAGPHLKWEFPVDDLPHLAYDLTRAKLTDMGSNAVLLGAVLPLKGNLPIGSSDLDRLIRGLFKDYSYKRTMIQDEIERNQFEATAMFEPEAVSFMAALFDDPANVGKLINNVLNELELVLAVPHYTLEEAGYVPEPHDYGAARAGFQEKFRAIGTILEYYFYLIQVGYYSIGRAAAKGVNVHKMHVTNSATSWNPFTVRSSLPVPGYAVVYGELLNMKDSLNRLVAMGIVDQDMFHPLEYMTTRFQIAAYMEMYFMGRTVEWRETAAYLERFGFTIGRDMTAIFQMLGLEEFEQRVLGESKIDSWLWEGYHLHLILVQLFERDQVGPGYRWHEK